MSSFEETPFEVVADPDVETFVIDHAFHLVHRGVGSFRHAVRPGLYKFKFRQGKAVVEQLLEVPAAPPEELRIHAPAADPPKAELALVQRERAAPSGIGGSSAVVIVAGRDAMTPDSLATFELHDVGGRLLFDVLAHPSVILSEGRLVYAINVDAGAYRLRCRHHGEPDEMEMMLYAPTGWQTQVYVDDMDSPIASASIFVSPANEEPDPTQLRLTESALLALREKRTLLPAALTRTMLREKTSNPMLGIYAAHALLAAGGDEELLAAAVSRLEDLLPGHPDVAALRIGSTSGLAAFRFPPMLRASWRRIVDASLAGTAVIEAESLAARIPPVLLDSTPWLIWSPGDLLEPPTRDGDMPDALQRVVSAVTQNVLPVAHGLESLVAETPAPNLTADESDLYALLGRWSRLEEHTKEKRRSPSAELDEKRLARSLGTTLPHVRKTLRSLAGKLEMEKGKP